MFSIFLAATALWSSAQPIEELLREGARPSITRVFESGITLADLRGNPETLQGYGLGWPSFWIYRTLQEGPRLIASVEKAFPGARLAFIGRDSALIGDIFEGFYALGSNPSRVIRLGVSRNTFGRLEAKTLLAFLKQQGLDPNTFREGPPWLLVDTISRGGGRQGRAILGHLRSELSRLGVPNEHLFRRLNMVGLEVSTYEGDSYSIEHFTEWLDRQARPPAGANEVPFLTFRSRWQNAEAHPGFGEIGYEHYTGAWHGPHGPLVRVGDRWEATPLSKVDPDLRQVVLAYQLLIGRVVTSQVFAQRVATLSSSPSSVGASGFPPVWLAPLATREWSKTLAEWPATTSQIERAAAGFLELLFRTHQPGETLLESAPEAIRTLRECSQYGDRMFAPLLRGMIPYLESGHTLAAIDLGFILATLIGHGRLDVSIAREAREIYSNNLALRAVLDPDVLELYLQFPHQVIPIREFVKGLRPPCNGPLT